MGSSMGSSSEEHAVTHDIRASTQNRYEVTRKDLPLSCPMPGMVKWDSHPRVFLPIDESGEEKCPYCGAVYVLVPEAENIHR